LSAVARRAGPRQRPALRARSNVTSPRPPVPRPPRPSRRRPDSARSDRHSPKPRRPDCCHAAVSAPVSRSSPPSLVLRRRAAVGSPSSAAARCVLVRRAPRAPRRPRPSRSRTVGRWAAPRVAAGRARCTGRGRGPSGHGPRQRHARGPCLVLPQAAPLTVRLG
jgi:hypothetical protein